MSKNVAVLIPAAGQGTRFKGKVRKQFADIDNRAVFIRTLEMFADRDDVKKIVIAIPQDDQEIFEIKWSAKLAFLGVKVILGGNERYDTINRLLNEVQDDAIDLIALHDAVRPCVTKKQIDAVFKAAGETGAAILACPLSGTIKQIDPDNNIAKTIDRSELWEAQTPQVFKPEIIRNAYKNLDSLSEAITDDAQLVEATGTKVKIVKSDSGNIKITQPSDLTIAAAILKSRPIEKPKGGPSGPFAAEKMW